MSTACRSSLVLAAALAMTACADDSGAATPTPFLTPTPAGQAAIVYVLTQRMVPGYHRAANTPLNPAGMASQNALPSLQGELTGDGFINGAHVEYTPPPTGTVPLPFGDISSDAIIFGDAAGAGRYFAAERTRVSAATAGATVSPLTGLPRVNVDEMAAFQSALPPPAGVERELAYIAVLRHGRVVSVVFARGTSASLTNPAAFLPLVTGQETLLALPPGI